MRTVPIASRDKTCITRRFLHFFACDATGIDRIVNRRTGGDFSYRNRTFLYTSTSHSCEINIQILNCVGSFDGVLWRTAARTACEPWSTLSAGEGVDRSTGEGVVGSVVRSAGEEVCNGGFHVTAVGITLREGESRSSK